MKRLFREGQEVRILLGTDALSEGLNLETCDRMFNYDMPWNFMRVEQRIGRIDRIGGRLEVKVTNYFYKDTVEERVYTGIAEDAEWFDHVVGPAQPVLGRVEAVIQGLAMKSPGKGRDEALARELAEVRQAIAEAKGRAVQLSSCRTSKPRRENCRSTATPQRRLSRSMTSKRFSRRILSPPRCCTTTPMLCQGPTFSNSMARSMR